MNFQAKPFWDRQINSAQNEVFRALEDCLTGKGIKKHSLFIVSGARVVEELLATRKLDLARDLIVCPDLHDAHSPGVSSAISHREHGKAEGSSGSLSLLALGRELFDRLDIFGTKSPLLVLKTPLLKQADLLIPPKGIEVLCAMSDPSNLGALVRSAAALGASKIILLKEAATPFHPKATRSASAAMLQIHFEQGPSIQQLSEIQGPLVALDMNGVPINEFTWPKDVRLLIGEEGMGVPAQLQATRVSIPMQPGIESLNAAISASIALYSYRFDS